MDLESVFNSAVTGERQGKSVWQAEVALRLSKSHEGPKWLLVYCMAPSFCARFPA